MGVGAGIYIDWCLSKTWGKCLLRNQEMAFQITWISKFSRRSMSPDSHTGTGGLGNVCKYLWTPIPVSGHSGHPLQKVWLWVLHVAGPTHQFCSSYATEQQVVCDVSGNSTRNHKVTRETLTCGVEFCQSKSSTPMLETDINHFRVFDQSLNICVIK